MSFTNRNLVVAGAAVAAVGGLALLLNRIPESVKTLTRMFASNPSMILAFAKPNKETTLLQHVLSHAKAGDAQSVLNTIDSFCRASQWMMNVGDDKGKILDDALTQQKPRIVVELGAYCGYSAVRIASQLPDDGMLYSIEINPEFAAVAKQIVHHAGLSNKVTFLIGSLESEGKQLKETIDTADFVFIDHWKDCYLPDIKRLEALKLLRKGTMVVADNVITPGAPDYLAYIRASALYDSKHYESHLEYKPDIKDGVEVSIYKGE